MIESKPPPYQKKAGVYVTDLYFKFDVPGQQPLHIHYSHIELQVFANDNSNCLVGSADYATFGINKAVNDLQNLLKNPPLGQTTADIVATSYFKFQGLIRQDIQDAIQLYCNPYYLVSADVLEGNTFGFPVNNCDLLIGSCPH